MKWLCIFFPEIIAIGIEKHRAKDRKGIIDLIVDYGTYDLLINLIDMILISYVLVRGEVFIEAMNSVPFAIKYFLMSVVFSCILPFCSELINKYLTRTGKSFSFVFFSIAFWTIVFLIVLAINSANWMNKNFGGIDFRTALFQLKTPIKGTSHEILFSYLKDSLFVSFLQFVVIVFVGEVWKKIFCLAFVRTDKNIQIRTLWGRVTYIAVLFCFLLGCLFQSAQRIGVGEYFKSKLANSTYLEDNFVDPREVTISKNGDARNLIFIYMESMESTYSSIEEGGGKSINYIPYLTELAKKNTCFSNTDSEFGGYNWYSPCGWTTAALFGSASGAPYLIPNIIAEDYEELLPNLFTLGDVLEEKGYNNYFMCGSNSVFGAKKAFYQTHGNFAIFDQYTAMDDGIIPEGYFVFWGMEDEYLYKYAKDKLEIIGKYAQPFNFTMLTADTHHPDGYICDLCKNEYDSQYANAISCADRQINEFMQWIENQEWYDNTTIVIVGDHNSMNNSFWEDLPENYERSIYNCFINLAPGVVTNNTKNREMTSLDLFPTTLVALGFEVEGNRLGLGTNMFSDVPTLQERDGKEYFDKESQQDSAYFENRYILNIGY